MLFAIGTYVMALFDGWGIAESSGNARFAKL